MSSDFGYVNARVRGMASRLLGPETYQAALAAEDFRGFTAVLGQSPYAHALEEAQAQGDGLKAVDRALADDFHATTKSMLAFTDGAPRRMIAALLRRYDLEDLKTVARAHHAGRDPSEMGEALTGAGELRPATIESLVAAPDLPTAGQALSVTKHPLAHAFVRAARRYANDGDLLAFELALDHATFRLLSETGEAGGTSDTFRRHVEREIDAANLRTALKVAGRDIDADTLFVEGGREVKRDTFLQLAEAGLSGLSALGSGTFAPVAQAEDLAGAERAIRTALDEAARRAALRDPLGIGVVIRYLRDKESEAAKLRLLARGAYYHVPRNDLEKELGHA
ncbi:MAG: V-type ATPase subunit [Trueperaceae bacterium]|nr:V-type ATPase subunit [Trueperaceae bacterium]